MQGSYSLASPNVCTTGPIERVVCADTFWDVSRVACLTAIVANCPARVLSQKIRLASWTMRFERRGVRNVTCRWLMTIDAATPVPHCDCLPGFNVSGTGEIEALLKRARAAEDSLNASEESRAEMERAIWSLRRDGVSLWVWRSAAG